MNDRITVIGAGLAGCEAAWQIAKRNIKVKLIEMKPLKKSPAHKYDGFAELVCSNSLRSSQITNAVGLLKEEMRRLDSLIMEAADNSSVPAGSALAVDRYVFSDYITNKLRSHPFIEVVESEVENIPENETVIIATGPLTSGKLYESIRAFLGEGYLSFFDAAAPIVDASTIDMNKAYYASRYNKGEASYLNCPMTKDEYENFYSNLVDAKEAELKDFDKDITVFEGCMPVEVMAKRGKDTLRFGPLKPVGLPDPKTGNEPYAVVQLRSENRERTMFNLVGFQTHLTFGEQKRVFGMIPGLENAEFLRYGVMHRNTFINSPSLLEPDYSVRKRPELFFAGQMTGVEGYVESAASGLIAGINAAARVMNVDKFIPEDISMIGAMSRYISDPNIKNFQPMNANFGLIRSLNEKVKGGKIKKYEVYASRSLEYINGMSSNHPALTSSLQNS